MGSGKCMIALLMITGLLQSVAADNYTVGGAVVGWALGQTATFYDDWAAGLAFKIGDVLIFPYPGNTHNVYEVSQADLAICNVGNPIATYVTANGAAVPITTDGYHGYICAIGLHCQENMKMSITVGAALAPTGAPVPSPSMAPAKAPMLAPSKSPAASGPALSPSESTSAASYLRSSLETITGALVAVFFSILL